MCSTDGEKVNIETVQSLIKPDIAQKIISDDYYICLDSSCEVAYFTSQTKLTINTDDINTPIHYKQSAQPKYACYCNKVTIAEVILAIKTHHCKSIKDLMKNTKVMINGKCKTTHPKGQCCSTELNKLLRESS